MSETLGRNCRFLQGPGTDPAAAAEIRAAVDEKRACVVEILNYRRDGTSFWNRLSITPVRDELGEVTHYIGIQSGRFGGQFASSRAAIADLRPTSLIERSDYSRVPEALDLR